MHVLVEDFWKGRNRFPKKHVGDYFDNDKKPKACCHLGAIIWGEFGKIEHVYDLILMYPELHRFVDLPCDDTGEPVGYISSILIHLSDSHDKRTWPDEKVAEWLEQTLAV